MVLDMSCWVHMTTRTDK